MFVAFLPSFLAAIALVASHTHAAEEPRKCEFKRKYGVYYSPKASDSYGKILKKLNSSNEDECQRSCCDLHNCTLFMYSTLTPSTPSDLHKYDANCLLFFCGNNTLCHTRPVPHNITGISMIGIKQDVFAIDSMVNNGSEDVTITKLQVMHSSLSNPTISSFTKPKFTIPSFTIPNSTIPNSTIPSLIIPSLTISLNPSSTTSSIRSTSSINGTTISNSTVGQLISHHGNNHTGSPPNTSQSQPNNSPRNHTQSIHLGKKPVHSSHKIELRNGTHSSMSLDSSVRHTTHSQIIRHTLSPPANSSSTLTSNVVNASEDSSFSHLHLSSLSSFASVSTIFMSKSPPSDTFPKSHASKISPSSPNTSHASTTSVKQSHKKNFSESHTTPASLVISLIIGILFFGTVLFLIGRRWSETCFRRGYSRVDYLLNDYD